MKLCGLRNNCAKMPLQISDIWGGRGGGWGCVTLTPAEDYLAPVSTMGAEHVYTCLWYQRGFSLLIR